MRIAQVSPLYCRDGCWVPRRNAFARLARAAGLFAMLEPVCRYSADRDWRRLALRRLVILTRAAGQNVCLWVRLQADLFENAE